MVDVVKNLKQEISNNEKVKNSILGLSGEWKNNHYEALSHIINTSLSEKIDNKSEHFFTLVNTISQITLKRIFEGNIKESAYKDLRFLKTLDKITIFLGYENLNEFIAKTKNKINVNDIFEITNQEFQGYKDLIFNCCNDEFSNIKTLPNINLTIFDQYVLKNSPYENRLAVYLNKLRDQKIKLVAELSNFEIYNYKLISIDSNMIVMNTNEFWNLVFIKNGNHTLYHRKAEQTYYLKKDADKWKIWDNYNPDYEDIINPKKP